MSFLQTTFVPDAMHVVGEETSTSHLQFGQRIKLSICFFNGALSSMSRVDGGNNLLGLSAGSSVVVVVVTVTDEILVSPVF